MERASTTFYLASSAPQRNPQCPSSQRQQFGARKRNFLFGIVSAAAQYSMPQLAASAWQRQRGSVSSLEQASATCFGHASAIVFWHRQRRRTILKAAARRVSVVASACQRQQLGARKRKFFWHRQRRSTIQKAPARSVSSLERASATFFGIVSAAAQSAKRQLATVWFKTLTQSSAPQHNPQSASLQRQRGSVSSLERASATFFGIVSATSQSSKRQLAASAL